VRGRPGKQAPRAGRARAQPALFPREVGRPLSSWLVGKHLDAEAEGRRALRAADWALRVFAPRALSQFGHEADAATRRAIGALIDTENALRAAGVALAARQTYVAKYGHIHVPFLAKPPRAEAPRSDLTLETKA
jgi:hypothetical protein